MKETRRSVVDEVSRGNSRGAELLDTEGIQAMWHGPLAAARGRRPLVKLFGALQVVVRSRLARVAALLLRGRACTLALAVLAMLSVPAMARANSDQHPTISPGSSVKQALEQWDEASVKAWEAQYKPASPASSATAVSAPKTSQTGNAVAAQGTWPWPGLTPGAPLGQQTGTALTNYAAPDTVAHCSLDQYATNPGFQSSLDTGQVWFDGQSGCSPLHSGPDTIPWPWIRTYVGLVNATSGQTYAQAWDNNQGATAISDANGYWDNSSKQLLEIQHDVLLALPDGWSWISDPPGCSVDEYPNMLYCAETTPPFMFIPDVPGPYATTNAPGDAQCAAGQTGSNPPTPGPSQPVCQTAAQVKPTLSNAIQQATQVVDTATELVMPQVDPALWAGGAAAQSTTYPALDAVGGNPTVQQAVDTADPHSAGYYNVLNAIESVPAAGPQRGENLFDGCSPANGMATADIISQGPGNYYALYQDANGPYSDPHQAIVSFEIRLAHSTDLIHWSCGVVLDNTGASQGTLRQIPGTSGYLLAYEKYGPNFDVRNNPTWDYVRIRYYPSLNAVESNQWAAQKDLRRVYYPYYNNGTPNFMSIQWNGSLKRSVVKLGFHWESSQQCQSGPDREALGTLTGFNTWTTTKDTTIDNQISAQHPGPDNVHLTGTHGDRTQWSYDGHLWRTYEGQEAWNPCPENAPSHLLFYDVSAKRLTPITLTIDGAQYSTSFGNAAINVVPAPNGTGNVLVVAVFVSGQASSSPLADGEMIYYNPIS